MSWTVEYDPELGVVQCTYAGQLTGEAFRESTIKAIALAKDNDTNLFLIDDSKLEGGTSVSDLVELPDLYQELRADRRSRAALILPPHGTAVETDARFYETACRNRGWQVSVFLERQEAINWLNKKRFSDKPDAGDGE